MKKITFTLFLISLFYFANAQAVSYTPKGANFDSTITISINLNLATGMGLNNLLNSTQPLYLWAGAGSAMANAFEYTPKGQTNFNSAFDKGLLKKVGINKYEITINPKTYFDVPQGKSIAVIGILVKNATGNAQTTDMQLLPNTIKNNEVVITAKKPFVENQLDKTVLNVQNDINAIGSSAFEILQKAPGITITGEDNIKMAGKGSVNVLIDGRPVQMGEKDLANYLKSTPGANIDKIELITNPSSKYDAQGSAGIINIKLKRSKTLGTNGNISTDYTQNVHNRYGTSINLNNRNKVANIYGNGGYRQSYQHTTGGVDRTIIGVNPKFFTNTTLDKDDYKSANYRLGADFTLSKKSTLGVLTNGNVGRDVMITPGVTLIQNNAKITDSSIRTDNYNKFNFNSNSNNLNYAYEDTMGNQLNADADYVYFNNKQITNTNTKLVNKINTVYDNKINILNTNTVINIYSFKVDYIKTLKKQKAKIETGIKTNFVDTRNNLAAEKLAYNTISPDSLRSNRFDYTENVNAAYAMYSKEVNSKFAYQVGLRAEQSNIKGKSTDIYNRVINNPDTTYLNIFPTAFVKYTASKSSQFIAAYSRRLNRPDYQAMNPFENVVDIYTSQRGNPFLRPEYANNYELKYVYKDAASLGVGFTQTKDFLQNIVSQEGEKTFATQKNLGEKNSLYFQFNLPIPVTKKYEIYAAFTAYNNRYMGTIPEGTFNVAAWGFNGYMSNDYKLPNNYKLQVSGWWQMPGLEGIGRVKAFGSADVGVQKAVYKKKLNVQVSVTDLFNTQRYQEGAVLNTINYTYFRKWESRGVRFNLNYKFGNKNVKQNRNRDTGEDANRIQQKK